MSKTLIVSRPGMGAMYHLGQTVQSPKLTLTLSHCMPTGKSGATTFDAFENYIKNQLSTGACFDEAVERANKLNVICDLTDQNQPWHNEVQAEMYDTFFDSDLLAVSLNGKEATVSTDTMTFTFVIHRVNETLEEALARTVTYQPLADIINQCKIVEFSPARQSA